MPSVFVQPEQGNAKRTKKAEKGLKPHHRPARTGLGLLQASLRTGGRERTNPHDPIAFPHV